MSRPQLTPGQQAELSRLKAYFPFRIVFGVVDKDTGAFEARAVKTQGPMRRALEAGHHVWTFK